MKKRNSILIHLLFWTARLAPNLAAEDAQWPLYLSFNLVAVTTFYINYFVVMPRLFARRNYGGAAAAWAVLLCFFTAFRYGLEEVLFPAWLGFRNYGPETTLPEYAADNMPYYALPTLMFSSLLWLLTGYIRSRNEHTELLLEKQRAELNFLKSQVNPHFLFNNLNSIYSLVYSRSDKALPALQKLSDIMRYLVREATLDTIPVARELQYVEDLIGLQALRVAGTAAVRLEVDGPVDDLQLAPLLLVPFVENGFKHGDITDAAEPFLIRVRVSGRTLDLYTRNKIGRGPKDATGGIGLANLKQRLRLLYPGAHQLSCGPQGDAYICHLQIAVPA